MLGPIFRHEMFAAGRKRRFTATRVLIGLLLLAILSISYASVTTQGFYVEGEYVGRQDGLTIAARSQLTAQFYTSFAWMMVLGVLAVTPAVSAGAIASERERRTIEYLFATQLSNAEIVLDKIFARLMVIAQLALCTLPLLAIFRLLGGVPGELVLLHFLMMTSCAAAAASISLAVSTWCERARDAVPQAYGYLLMGLFAPMFLYLWNDQCGNLVPWLTEWVTEPLYALTLSVNPVYVLSTGGGVSSGTLGVDLNTTQIYTMVAGQFVLAVCCLGLCVFAVRRVHLRDAGKGSQAKQSDEARGKSRTPYADRPMLWKELFATSASPSNQRLRKRIGIAVLLLVIGGPIVWNFWEALISPRRNAWEEYFQMSTIFVAVISPILLLLVGCRAAGLVTYEKERETWLSLLTAPLEAKEIVYAKLLGNLHAFRWAFVGLLMIPSLGLILNPLAFWVVILLALTLGAIAVAGTAIGLMVSLRAKTSTKAIGTTIAILVGIGGGYMPFAAAFAIFAGDDELMMLFMAPCVPFLCVAPTIFLFDSPPDEIVGAYVVGLMGYGVLGSAMLASVVQRFDELSERGSGEWESQPPTPSAAKRDESGPLPEAI